ncbi:MAG: protein kinase, partial [Nannocystaceae bacterium]
MTTLDRSALAAPSRSEDTLAGLFGDDAAGLSEQAAAARVRSALLGEPTRPPQLTRYRLRRVLGEGAMGQVWLADDPQLSREVAIKLVKAPESAHAEVLLRRLAREAKAMARLSHPNVVQIYDVGREPGGGHGAPRLFIVMERVDGETLAQWLATPRPWRDIVRIFAQACDGLAAAHRAGLVHRDFKPGNVFVGRDGRVRVGDFGLARTGATVPAAAAPIDVDAAQLHSTLAGSLTHTGAIVGTPLYMAPEQHAGEAVTAASDQYALCVALFEALAQTRPFAGGLSEVVAAKQARALPTSRRLAAVPEPLLAAVQRGLAPDPRDRFATVEALAEVLRASLRRGPRARWLMLAAAAGTPALWWTLASRGEGCERPRETERAWTPDAREQARAAIAALTQDAHASRALAQIDEHARALADASSAMCQGGTPEPGPLLCLRAHDVQLATTIARIVDGDRTAIELAPRALEGLPAPGSCAHDVALHPMPPESFDTELRLRDGLARAKALFDLDAAGESARTAQPLYDELVALGEPATELRAEAALQLGNALVVLGRPDEGDAMLRAAYFDATSAGDARVAVRAASGLAT